MIFVIILIIGFVISISFSYVIFREESVGSAIGAFFVTVCLTGMVASAYMGIAVGVTDSDTPTSTTTKTYDMASFSEYGGGEPGGLYVTVGGESDTVSFVLDGKIVQEDEENVTIVTSDSLKIDKISGVSSHPIAYPWTFDTVDTYTLHVPQTAVDFTAN